MAAELEMIDNNNETGLMANISNAIYMRQYYLLRHATMQSKIEETELVISRLLTHERHVNKDILDLLRELHRCKSGTEWYGLKLKTFKSKFMLAFTWGPDYYITDLKSYRLHHKRDRKLGIVWKSIDDLLDDLSASKWERYTLDSSMPNQYNVFPITPNKKIRKELLEDSNLEELPVELIDIVTEYAGREV